MNNKEATIAGLLKCGLREVHRSRKYRCFEEPKPVGVPFRTFLVGKSGALRVITAQCTQISESISRTNSKQHKAFQYIGRLGVDVSPEKAQEIYSEYVRGVISE